MEKVRSGRTCPVSKMGEKSLMEVMQTWLLLDVCRSLDTHWIHTYSQQQIILRASVKFCGSADALLLGALRSFGPGNVQHSETRQRVRVQNTSTGPDHNTQYQSFRWVLIRSPRLFQIGFHMWEMMICAGNSDPQCCHFETHLFFV